MAKEDTNRLLSKVAKFVRNPLKDWTELDTPEPTPEEDSSRAALRQMIERRQRNDFVRRREFDTLRKLRRHEAVTAVDAESIGTSLLQRGTRKTGARTLALKIDEIEAQMSQQWWKNGEGPSGLAPVASPPAGPASTSAAPVTQSSGLPNAQAPSRFVAETALEVAALRFAHRDDAGAEALLLQAVASGGAWVDHDDTWRALLDLYRATGDAEKFAAAGTRYAQRFKRPAPDWVSLRGLARALQDEAPVPADGDAAHWYCPERLDRPALAGLMQALSQAGAVWHIDWRALRQIDPAAVAPLATLCTHWGDSPVQLRIAGVQRLVGVLAQATPLLERATDPAWWLLHLAVLRVLNQIDGFELVALNYCITYEAAPPPWRDPAGQCTALDDAQAPAAAAPGQARPAGGARLAGELAGEQPRLAERLDAELAGAEASVVSCAALLRVDAAAARQILQWARARAGRDQQVALTELHRLVLAFLQVAGVAAHAALSPRD
jgi:ABC-type transporter Mla MlaB component